MTEPRLCDEDVRLASEESSRHSTEEQSTRGEADQSEGSTIIRAGAQRLCQPESHSGPIQFLACAIFCVCLYMCLAPSGAYTLTGRVMID